MFEVKPQSLQYDDEVVHDSAGLEFYTRRQWLTIVIRVGRHLSSQLDPAIAFDRVAKWRYMGWCFDKVVKDWSCHGGLIQGG